MPTELFVSRIGRQVWTALREDGRTVAMAVEHPDDPGRVGRICKGRVSAIVPSLQAAFIDVGDERDAFVHASELIVPGEAPAPRARRGADPAFAAASATPLPPIEQRLKKGRELLVQVSRQGTGAKGDRATSYMAIAGRFLVYFPFAGRNTVSRRIPDPGERERLETVLAGLDPGPHGGFVARTAAIGAESRQLANEALALGAGWERVRQQSETTVAPGLVYREPGLAVRTILDAPPGVDRIVIDDPADRHEAKERLAGIDDSLAARIEPPVEAIPLVVSLSLDREATRALESTVRLPSGGDIVIEQTEAFVSIDVNSGRATDGRIPERNLLETNLEAAEEIARQLRLRDLGGIVVIDFVDLEEEANRRLLAESLTRALRDDPARTKVLEANELGVVQMTRKRTRAGLESSIAEACGNCKGRGRKPGARFVAVEIIAELTRRSTRSEEATYKITADADTTEALRDACDAARERGASWVRAVSAIEADADRKTPFRIERDRA